MLASQGWDLHRLWTPTLFREPQGSIDALRKRHEQSVERMVKDTLGSQTGLDQTR